MGDTIGNFLSQINNAYLARRKSVEVWHGKVIEEIAKILKKGNFVDDVKVKTNQGKKVLLVSLSYPKRKPALSGIRRISKPGLRVYVRAGRIPQVLGGIGVVIISTAKGIMTGKEARKLGLGGEVFCEVW